MFDSRRNAGKITSLFLKIAFCVYFCNPMILAFYFVTRPIKSFLEVVR